MILSVCICLTSFVLMVVLLRRDGVSLGLPAAYLYTLLFIHVPGALAHLVGGVELTPTGYTATGIRYTAIGAACFVVGVWLTRLVPEREKIPWIPASRSRFAVFCLVAGLVVTFSLRLIVHTPSIGAVVEKGGSVWMLGSLLGLRGAFKSGVWLHVVIWGVALFVYPMLTLLFGGFLSFGSTTVFIVLAGLTISTRRTARVAVGILLLSVLFVHLFLSYFSNRDSIRDAVWGGANMETRVERSLLIIKNFAFFNLSDSEQLVALDERLNQNYFVGLAAERIEFGVVEFLRGRSIREGALSLVPRLVWPDKPVYAGSPMVVMEMTGFEVNENTSYGVGNVMEFYINFGLPSLIGGFLVLGLLFGWLDRHAALAERGGNMGQCILYFLPAAVMIHPNGSLVELMSGGAAAFLAALGWRWLWERWSGREAGLRGRQRKRNSPRGREEGDASRVGRGQHMNEGLSGGKQRTAGVGNQ